MPTTRWGKWSYDAKRFTLTYGPENYDVELNECRNSAEVLDWILQVTHKTWMTPHGVRDFVKVINDILHPQGNICSGGVDTTINPRQVARSQGYGAED